ncbi:hypothetical protein ACP70R_000795 [Stipagrostis hirtigluma subsp. patula]
MGFDSSTIVNCAPRANSYVRNLTNSYVDQSDENSVAATSIVMFFLAAAFFVFNLFSRVSDISSILKPGVRTFLSTSLDLFIPVMSYLFSEAKNSPPCATSLGRAGNDSSALSPRARMILMWMILVQLLRKKLEGFLAAADTPGYLGTIFSHGSGVFWLGYLVFSNLKSTGQKAVFGIFWLIGAVKFVQRVVINELGRRSLAYGRNNARLVSSYMATVIDKDTQVQPVVRHSVAEPSEHGGRRINYTGGGDSQIDSGENYQSRHNALELLKSCKYVVMGEENLVKEAGPHGYLLKLDDDGDVNNQANVVTVAKVWDVLTDPSRSPDQDIQEKERSPDVRHLCLSFGLSKILRRKIEHLPPFSKAETDNCRRLMFHGLCKAVREPEVALFQVLSDEVNFLTEYYNSVFPVVLASPFFFVVNYLMVPIMVFSLSIMVIVLCGNGDVFFAITRITQDNYAMSPGAIIPLTRCLMTNILRSTSIFFATMDLFITVLLFLTFMYEQLWEVFVILLSNWFTVSLASSYTASNHQCTNERKAFNSFVRLIWWSREQLSRPGHIKLSQYSVLSFPWPRLMVPDVSMPDEAKRGIMKHLMEYDSIAEVILTWHIATSMFETAYPRQKAKHLCGRDTATTLSKHCAYLVAYNAELVPDDREGTKHIYKGMKKELKKALGQCWGYYIMSKKARYDKMMWIAIDDEKKNHERQVSAGMKIVEKGARLGKNLKDRGEQGNEAPVWEMLADLWIELILYVAPSSGEEHDKGHEDALVQGGELVTLLWALATHTGITRRTHTSVSVDRVREIGSPALMA